MTDSPEETNVPSAVNRRTALGLGGALALGALGSSWAGLAGTAQALEDDPLPEQLAHIGSSTQVIVVKTRSARYHHGTIQAWQKVGGVWKLRLAPSHANIGLKGWVRPQNRRQGDLKTPAGTFRIHKTFGYQPNPGTRLHYKRLDHNDYWAGDQRDPKTYNIFQTSRPKTAKWRVSQSEPLYRTRPAYQYVAPIDFNTPTGVHQRSDGQWVADQPADVRLGGGIFLHCYGTTGWDGYTLGCVCTATSRMRWMLRWLDPDARPVIVMGPSSEITEL